MSKALEMVFAEMTLKDMASKGLEKISKTSKAAQAAVMGVEKGMRSMNAASAAMEKSLSKGGKFEGFGAMNQRGQNFANAAASGNMFHQAISQVHIIGPYLGAALTAMHATAQQYQAGVEQMREDTIIGANYSRAFDETARKKMADMKKGLTGFFRQKDWQVAASGLRDMGVSQTAVSDNAQLLEKFGKAQGLGSAQEAVQALVSGNIKQGAGVSDTQIQVMKQAVGQMSQNGASADMMFRYVAGMLKQSEANLDKIGSKFDAGKGSAGAMIRESNRIRTNEEAFTAGGANKVSAGTYDSGMIARKSERDVQQMLGGLGGQGVKALKGVADKIKSKMRARGGPVRRGESYIVGEERPEMFTPGQSGMIHPRVPSGGGATNITLNVYSSGDAKSIAQAVRSELATLFNTSMRLNMGLRMAG